MLTSPRKPFTRFFLAELLVLLAIPAARGQQSEPPALNPFGSRAEREDQKRDDAVPGFVEMSDGKVHPGQVMLTRDARLKIFDEQQKKHREIPSRRSSGSTAPSRRNGSRRNGGSRKTPATRSTSRAAAIRPASTPTRSRSRTARRSMAPSRGSSTSGPIRPPSPSVICSTSATRAIREPISNPWSMSARSSSAPRHSRKASARRPGRRARRRQPPPGKDGAEFGA